MLVDSHCHLDYFPDELDAVMARAAAAGVATLVTIGTTMEQSVQVRTLAEAYPNLWCTVGVHPMSAAKAPVPSPAARVRSLARTRKHMR